MNVHIATVDFDLDGYVLLKPFAFDMGAYNRRANKRQTLDADVAVFDGGFSHGDRVLSFTFYNDETTDSTLKNIVQYHAQVYVSMREGVFKAIPQYSPGFEESTFTASVIEKIV